MSKVDSLLTFWEKARIRLFGRIKEPSWEGFYIGYCRVHRIYYEDRLHTNEEIRCPTCDANWLAKHKVGSEPKDTTGEGHE